MRDCGRQVLIRGAQKDRHCGLGQGAEGHTQGEDSRLLEAGCGAGQETYSQRHRQGSAVPPIRSPARAAASQCWLLEEEAAGNTRYAVRKVPPGATSHHRAAGSFSSADIGCSRLCPLNISFTQVSLPLKFSLEFHF